MLSIEWKWSSLWVISGIVGTVGIVPGPEIRDRDRSKQSREGRGQDKKQKALQEIFYWKKQMESVPFIPIEVLHIYIGIVEQKKLMSARSLTVVDRSVNADCQ